MERDRLVLIVLLFLVCILLSSLVVAGPCGNKVAAVGDSQTAMASYVVELRKLCGLDKSTLKNEDGDPATSQKLRGSDKFAFVGKHTSEMKRDFNAVLEWGPDTMILMGGGNDVGGSPQAIINNLKDMISRAKAKGIRVVSVTFGPFWNDEKRRVPKAVEVTRKVNEWILSPQNPADVKVNTYPLREDPEEKDAANKDLYVSDLVHLNKAGKKIIAEAMFNAMTGAPAVTSGTPYVPSTAAGPLSFPHCEGGDLSRLSEISGISRCYAHKELFDKYAHDEGLYDLGVDLLFTMLVAMGESGCMTSDEMAAKFTQGDHKSYGGIFQVDDPCRFKKSCVTLDLEIQEGMKELKRKFEDITDAATKRNYKLSAEDFALLWLFTYNRGWGTGSAALDRMVGGLSIQDATDQACASFYGYADGRPGKVKCSSGTRCKDGHLNDYRFYCGKRPAGGVYYASSRYGKYKKLCEQIGGRIVTQGSSVRSGQQTSLGPAPTLPSAYSYGVNADVLAPYSVIPSFTVAIPSILGLFEDAVEGIEKMDTCAGDLTCINGMISSMDNRPGSVRWLGKFAGTVLPQGSPMDALWLDRCETNNEYVLYSVAEALSTLKQATTDDCTLPIQTLPVALEAGATTRVAPSPGVSEPSVISDTGCPPEMANIEGQYCIDKWEAHVVDKNTGEPASPFYSIKPSSAKYQYRHYLNKPSPVQMPELPNVQIKDSFEPMAVSSPGVLPQGHMNVVNAELACSNAGKRLCTREEWYKSCVGPDGPENGRWYPFGKTFEKGKCNWNVIPANAFTIAKRSNVELNAPRMGYGTSLKGAMAKTGSFPECTNEYGVFDQFGNMDEVVAGTHACKTGKCMTFVGMFYSRPVKKVNARTPRGCAAGIGGHAAEYYDYSIGFRCCSGVGATTVPIPGKEPVQIEMPEEPGFGEKIKGTVKTLLGRTPVLKINSPGSSTKLFLEGVPTTTVSKAPLYIDDGNVERASDYKLDFTEMYNMFFYRENKDKFIYVEPDQISKYSEKPICNISTKTIKFCVFDEKTKMWRYDEQKKQLSDESGQIRFAYEFKKRMTNVNFNVESALYSTETVMIFWNAIPGLNVPQYKLFYSEDANEIEDVPTAAFMDDKELQARVETLSFDTEKMPTENIVEGLMLDNVPECVWDDEGLGLCSPQYELYGEDGSDIRKVVLKPGVLYFDRTADIYVYILQGIPNNKDVYYAMIGIADDQKKSPKLNAPMFVEPARDDQPPAPPADLSASRQPDGGVRLTWSSSDIKNIDGSLADDIDKYEIYCVGDAENDYSELSSVMSSPIIRAGPPASIDGALFGSKCDKDDRIVVIPVDKAGNHFRWKTDSVVVS